MGGRRRGRSNRAYGVAVTFLPHKGGAVPESEKRRAAWRIIEPSHTCLCSSFAVPSPHLFPAPRRGGGRGGGGRGCEVRCGACNRVFGVMSCVPSLVTTRSSSKKRKPLTISVSFFLSLGERRAKQQDRAAPLAPFPDQHCSLSTHMGGTPTSPPAQLPRRKIGPL